MSKNPAKFERCVRKVKRKRSGANPYAVCARTRKNAAMRANPLDQAEEVYQAFHGEHSRELVEVEHPVHVHKALSGIGELRKLFIKTDSGAMVTLSNFKGAILSQNEKRNQLFIRGGDQEVNLKAFGIHTVHEMEVLGKGVRVHYFTNKTHLRPEDGGLATYNHKFGGKVEDSRGKRRRSPLPTILYNTVTKTLEFAGGGYTLPDEGIDG